MRSVLAGIAFLLVLGLLAWNFLAEDDREFRDHPVPAVHDAGTEGAVPRRGPGSSLEVQETAPASLEADAPDNQRAESVGDYGIQCLDEESGDPISGAEVHVLDHRTGRNASGLLWTEDDYVRLGRKLVADGEGRVRVSLKGPFWVCARDESRVLVTRLEFDLARDVKLRLAARRDLRVRVVNAAGETRAGVPVQLQGIGLEGDRPRLLVEVETDEAGMALVPLSHLQPSRIIHRNFLSLGGLYRGEVDVHVVELDQPPEDVITLVQPACGRVIVQGGPVAVPEATICRLGASGYGGVSAPVVQGRAEFRNIGLGLTIGAWFDLPESHVGRLAIENQAGPSRDGEVVEMTIDTSGIEIAPHWRLRFLDDKGAPLPHVNATYESKNGSGTTSATDESGYLVGTMPRNLRSALSRGPVTFTVERGPHDPRLRSEIPTRVISAGLNELGDVRFQVVPLLVAGLVLDGAGEPLANMQIGVQIHDAEGHFRGFPENRLLDWRSASDGSFAIYARCEEAQVQLFVAGETLRVPVGTRDVVLRAKPFGSLRLVCKAEEGAGLGSVVLSGSRLIGDGRQDVLDLRLDQGPTNTLERILDSGEWHLRLLRGRGYGEGHLIHDFGVRMVAPGSLLDLGEILVPAHGIECRIELQDPPQMDLGSIACRIRDEKQKQEIGSVRTQASRPRIVAFNVDELPVTLEFQIPNIGVRRYVIDKPEMTISIEVAVTRRLKILPDPSLPKGLKVELRLTRASYADVTGSFIVGEREEIELECESPGRYELWLGTSGRMAHRGVPSDRRGYGLAEIKGGDGLGNRWKEIPLSADFLECSAAY